MATDPNVQITMVASNMLEARERALTSYKAKSNPKCSCGYPEGTFACKIRHVQLNTGDAKAAKD